VIFADLAGAVIFTKNVIKGFLLDRKSLDVPANFCYLGIIRLLILSFYGANAITRIDHQQPAN